jgi:hypothetical protein
MKGLSFSARINFDLGQEFRGLAEANEGVEEVLSEVDRVIETRFFNSNQVILGPTETLRWLWWEKTRSEFQSIANQISTSPF